MVTAIEEQETLKENYRTGKMKSWNIIAEIEGTSNADETVFVLAHQDGREIGQGALNNGSGATVVIEAARALAEHKGFYERIN